MAHSQTSPRYDRPKVRAYCEYGFRGRRKALPKLAAYGAAKAGLIHFTRTLAAEYADAGIRCVAIAPGPVHTGLVDKFTMAMIVRSVPLKRAALPAEIADFVRYIASNAVNLATGSVFTVDGGLSIRS
ncbi:MAG: hypothetical protein DME38_13930 [Verrucomicrobia bacterium]|nr:MAG: hypothetical protein DME38_13930 [Verrucomicrobiota bacterium]